MGELVNHVLKTDTLVFQAVIDGFKTFEIRFNDRDYKVGQIVTLNETKFTGCEMKAGKPLIYTGRKIEKKISYILDGYGLQDGWVILGIIDVQSKKSKIEQLEKRIKEGLEKIEQCEKEGCLFPEWLYWAKKALRGENENKD